jgi:hypothetical protein
MSVQQKPLTEITQEAVEVLYRELGVVNATRFLAQFALNLGNYTEQRDKTLPDEPLSDLVALIRGRSERGA